MSAPPSPPGWRRTTRLRRRTCRSSTSSWCRIPRCETSFGTECRPQPPLSRRRRPSRVRGRSHARDGGGGRDHVRAAGGGRAGGVGGAGRARGDDGRDGAALDRGRARCRGARRSPTPRSSAAGHTRPRRLGGTVRGRGDNYSVCYNTNYTSLLEERRGGPSCRRAAASATAW